MEKETTTWTVEQLMRLYASIDFPEYQREPNVWGVAAKRRLIDSMLRKFDIASIYVYASDEQTFDCIDGRQRIGAIMAFFGKSPEDADNGFDLRLTNEVYTDQALEFGAYDQHTFSQLQRRSAEGDAHAQRLIDALMSYRMTIVKLRDSARPEEFNLQFTRLNLGQIINSGEKLHAMVGAMRDICFADGELGQHPFLDRVKIPTRRYAKEQTAAQILSQVFSFERKRAFTRTRHFDLQRFVKEHYTLDEKQGALVERIRALFGKLSDAFAGLDVLRNRALTVSVVLLAWTRGVESEDVAADLAQFTAEFTARLKWHIRKEPGVDAEYRYLIDFQRHVTQASVEKPAVTERATVLDTEFARWRETKALRGDVEYKARTGRDASVESRR